MKPSIIAEPSRITTLFMSAACCMVTLSISCKPVHADVRESTLQETMFSIEKPLRGHSGDAVRGRGLIIARDKGNCLACHELPIPEEDFHGTIGPSLNGVGTRLSEGEIRFRVVNLQKINPNTVMPGYYKNPAHLNRVLDEYRGKPMLTAQEVEDIVAYLASLK